MSSHDRGDLSAGKQLVQRPLHVVDGLIVANVGNTTQVFDTDLATATDDFYTDSEILFVSGDNEGQVRRIIGYNGTTKIITVDEPFANIPATLDEFYIVPRRGGGSGVDQWVLAYKGTCDSGMAGSTPTVVCAELAGAGNDYFNTGWTMIIIKNANSVGNAPEGEIRDISDYVSATGTFTVDAFTANVEEGDEIIVMRSELLASEYMAKDFVIYIAAEDLGTTEMTDDGTDPLLLGEVSQSNANEAAGEASPAWSEGFDLDPASDWSTISVFAALRWRQKRTGGTTCSVKFQISGDGGGSWVDITDNVTETSTSYVDKMRVGEGLWIGTISAGTDQLQLRMCDWSGDATSVETKLRASSYIRVTARKA